MTQVHFNADEFPCPPSLPFESDRRPLEDIAFVEGFQTGRIYELLRADPDAMNGFSIPPSDAEFVQRIVRTLGLDDIIAARWVDGWLYLTGPNGPRS